MWTELHGQLSEARSFQQIADAVLSSAHRAVGASSASFLPLFPGAFSEVVPAGWSEYFSREHMFDGARRAFPLIVREWRPVDEFFKDSRRTLDMNAALPWDRMERMEVFQTYWRPCKIERQVISFAGSPEMPLGVICLARPREARAFAQDTVAVLDRMRTMCEPYVASIANEALHGESSCVLSALSEGLPMPCVLLDGGGRLLWLNEEAARRAGVRTTRVGLACITDRPPAATGQWREAVAECVRQGGGPTWWIGRLTIRVVQCSNGRTAYLVVDPDPVATRGTSLTSREWEVAQLAARGYEAVNIAAQLGVSDGTVRNHLKSIYRKLGVRSRASLASAILGW